MFYNILDVVHFKFPMELNILAPCVGNWPELFCLFGFYVISVYGKVSNGLAKLSISQLSSHMFCLQFFLFVELLYQEPWKEFGFTSVQIYLN